MEDHPAAWAADLRGFRDDPAARMATESPRRTVGARHRGTHASRFVSSGHGGDGRRNGTLRTPLGLAAALVGELEDFISGILKWFFPDIWVIGALLGAALITIIRHRRVMLRFFETMGHHSGAGLIAAALLIIYVFNRVIGAPQFWQATLGDAFSPEIPRICKSYLELLACYFIFVGSLGLAITLGRREELN